MYRILITGGAGFIGYHLARRLLNNSTAEITLADNLWRGRADADFKELCRNSRVRFLNLDLTDQASYRKLGTGYRHVYHLAAVNGTRFFYEMPHEVMRINTLSLAFMLEWMRRKNPNGKFLFTSSNEAYAGALESFGKLPLPTPEHVPLVISTAYNPRWTYATTKLLGEPYVIHYAAQYKFPAVIVRPHNFYGPRAGYDHVIPQFSLAIAQKKDPFPIRGADETRTFCYIDDAVRAFEILMESAKTDRHPIETVHIGDAGEITMKKLAEKMFAVAGWRPKKLDVRESPQGSVKRRCADISKLQKLVRWKPEITLDEGLKRTCEWYRTHPR